MRNKRATLRVLILSLGLLMMLSGICTGQNNLVQEEYQMLTSPDGWLVQNQVLVSADNGINEVSKNQSACQKSEVIYFQTNGTYSRKFLKKDCAGQPPVDTHGTWEYKYDKKVSDGILLLRLKDLVNDQQSRSYSVISVAKESGGIILSSLADDKPGAVKLIVLLRKNSTTTKDNLENIFHAIKMTPEEVPMSKTLDEVFELDKDRLEDGILRYSNKMTETGPYDFVLYQTNDKKNFVVDIQNDYTGSRLAIYENQQEQWKEVTSDFLGKDFETATIQSGFNYWKDKYSDGTVTSEGSSQELVYSLPVDNFLTRHSYIFVEIKVTWTSKKNEPMEDSRIIGKIIFNGETFEFVWEE